MGLRLRGSHMGKEVGWILGEIAEDEVNAGRAMLSALAVGVSGKPGPGFYSLARSLGRLKGQPDELKFWEAERSADYAAWKRPLPEGKERGSGE
jgi:hypothetical protein